MDLQEQFGKVSVLKDVIIASHIDDDTKTELFSLFKYYHKLWWCYQRMYKKARRNRLIIFLLTMGAITTGAAVGGITLLPSVIATLSVAGILIKGYGEVKNFGKRAADCHLAATTYNHTLNELMVFIRGQPFDKSKFIEKMAILDGTIIDSCPSAVFQFKNYNKHFR